MLNLEGLTPDDREALERLNGHIGLSGILFCLSWKAQTAGEIFANPSSLNPHPIVQASAPTLASGWQEMASQLMVLAQNARELETKVFTDSREG